MFFAWALNALALALVAGAAARAAIAPAHAQRLLQLDHDAPPLRPLSLGVAAAHAVALIMSLRYMLGGEHIIGLSAAGAAAALAAAWAAGAGAHFYFARRTPSLRKRAAIQAALALAIAAPWLVWTFG